MKNGVTKVLLMSVSCTLMVSQNLCLPQTPLVFHQGVSDQNGMISYENVKIRVAKVVHVTNCWGCSQLELGGMGFPWRAHPVGWPELCPWALTRHC